MGPGGKYLLIFVIIPVSLISMPASAMTPAWNITNNGEFISDIAFASDGSFAITGSMAGIATVYDQNGTIVWKIQVPGNLLVGCQENGSAFIVGSQENIYSNKGVVRSYDRNGSEIWRVNTGCIAALGLAGKNNRIVVGNRMGDIIVLDGNGKEVVRFNDFPQTDVVSGISVSDKGNIFAYTLCEMYPQIRTFNIDKQKKGVFRGLYNGSRTGYGGGMPITDIAISPDEDYIITSNGEGSQGTLCLYGNGRLIWSKDIDEITDIAILPEGSSVYAGTRNGDILGYSRSGNLSFVYSSGSAVTSLSLATDKNILAAGNAQGNLYLFNEAGTLLWTSRIEEFPVADISQVEISRNGEVLMVLVNNKNIYYFVNEAEPVPIETPQFTAIITPVASPTQSSLPVVLAGLGFFAAVVLTRRP